MPPINPNAKKLTKEEIQQRVDKYKEDLEKTGIPRVPTQEELDEFFASADKVDLRTQNSFNSVINNTGYSDFQNIKPYFRALIGVLNINMISELTQGELSLNNPKFVEVLNKHAFNAGLREGISNLKHTNPEFKKIDEYMNTLLFNKTLDVPTQEQRENVFNNVYAKSHLNKINELNQIELQIKNIQAKYNKIQSGEMKESEYLELLAISNNPFPKTIYYQMKAGTFNKQASIDEAKREIAQEEAKIEHLKSIEETEYNKVLESQKIMAKTMFMAQLSKYEVKDNKGNTIEYQGSIAETFAHGGRTNFILPHGENQTGISDAIFGKDPDKNAGFKQRTAASHYANRRKVENNKVLKESKEEKVSKANLPKILANAHYGMNFAAGGYGSNGPNNKPILADGTAGHMYCRKELGDKEHCGSLLIGYESCESGKTSVLGHEHNWRAKSSKQSAFLADKFGVGGKIDGRTVDLSGLSPDEFIKVMNNFDKVYSDLQQKASKDETAREKLSNFNKFLTGSRLEPEALKNVLIEVGMDAHIVNKAVTCARAGLESRTTSSEKQIAVPDKKAVEQYLNNFNKNLNKLDIDLSDNDSLKRLKVMEKVNGKWTIQPIFTDEKLTNEQKYAKINAIFNSNDTVIMAYAKGSVTAVEIKNGKNGFEVGKKSIEKTPEPVRPKPLTTGQKIARFFTFGRAFKAESLRYKDELANYNSIQEKNKTLSDDEISRTKEASKEIVNEVHKIKMSTDKQFLKDLGLDKSTEKVTSIDVDSQKIKTVEKDSSKNI